MKDIIPASWVELYAIVKDHFPQAILAGGAMRDWDNGRPVKDLDFFVGAPLGQGNDVVWREFFKAVEDAHKVRTSHGMDDDGGDVGSQQEHVLEIAYLESLDIILPDLNIMIVTKPTVEDQLSRFDLGICRIAYDGHVHRHEDYLWDQENRFFTITSAVSGNGRFKTIERFHRISPRYPGWRLIDPEELARAFGGAVEPELKSGYETATDLRAF